MIRKTLIGLAALLALATSLSDLPAEASTTTSASATTTSDTTPSRFALCALLNFCGK